MTAMLRAVLALAALFGVAAMLVWSTWLGIHAMGGMVVHTPYAAPPHLWHAHEMVFGYGGALLAGGLLATAPARIGRGVVALAAAVWLGGRGAMWFSAALDPVLVAAGDLAFLPLLALSPPVPVAAAPGPRKLALLGLVGMVWAGNLAVHLDWLGHGGPGAGAGLRAGLLALCAALVVVVTRSGATGQAAAVPPRGPLRWLDAVLIAGGLVLPLLVLVGLPDALCAGVALPIGGGYLLRLVVRRGAAAGPTTAAFGAGLVVWGLALLGTGSEIAGLHVLAVGTMGAAALAAMSACAGGASEDDAMVRATLGWAGGLILLSVVLRWGGSSLGIDLYFALMLASGAAWVLAMTLVLVALWPTGTDGHRRVRGPRPATAIGRAMRQSRAADATFLDNLTLVKVARPARRQQ